MPEVRVNLLQNAVERASLWSANGLLMLLEEHWRNGHFQPHVYLRPPRLWTSALQDCALGLCRDLWPVLTLCAPLDCTRVAQRSVHISLPKHRQIHCAAEVHCAAELNKGTNRPAGQTNSTDDKASLLWCFRVARSHGATAGVSAVSMIGWTSFYS